MSAKRDNEKLRRRAEPTRPAHLLREIDGVEQLAINVELQVISCTVTDANWFLTCAGS